MLVIRHIHIIDPLNKRNEIGDLRIDPEGRLCDLTNYTIQPEDQIIDGTGKIAYPGFVDIHVHFRDPGQTYKEDLNSGTMAAAAGGYTHVVCMANTIPVIDQVKSYHENQKRMTDLPIHVYQAAAISIGLKGKQLTDMTALKEAGVKMFTDDGIPLKDSGLVEAAMKQAKQLEVPLSFHEEDPTYIRHAGINQGVISQTLGFDGADRLAEIKIIERDIRLAKKTHACINIQHISSKEAVALVREAKRNGVTIHAEACPHHFTLTENAVLEYGSLAKMNPPLREEADRLAIIEGLRDGTIDIIATDHAPHAKEEKNRPLLQAPSGIIGLETAYALANEILVANGVLDKISLIEKMAINPGRLIGVRAALDLGQPANLVIVDPNQRWQVQDFRSKSENSPFYGRTMIGQVLLTIAKGKLVYQK